MSVSAVLVCCVAVVLAFSGGVDASRGKAEKVHEVHALDKMDLTETSFDAWRVARGNKKYSSESDEYEMRFAAWAKCMQFVQPHNVRFEAGEETYAVSCNKFAEWSKEEKDAMFSQHPMADSRVSEEQVVADFPYHHIDVSDSTTVDWRETHKVTQVKDQGACGSCWAFSVVGAIESGAAINGGFTWKGIGPSEVNWEGYSEQQLVSCDNQGLDEGCSGGYMTNGTSYVAAFGGIVAESTYPYQSGNGGTGQCKSDDLTPANLVATCDGYHHVPRNKTSFIQALNVMPISIGIDANCDEFMYYTYGVLSMSCGTQVDHGVLAVGYEVQPNRQGDTSGYWIVKNSWGDWGDDGYVQLAMSRETDSVGIDAILTQGIQPLNARSLSN
jgi:C1A family cysteine protease